MGISIRYNTNVTIPGLTSIIMNNKVECSAYKIINLFLFKDENHAVSTPINLENVQLLIFKTKDNKYSTSTIPEGNAGNTPEEHHIKYQFNNSDPNDWLNLDEPLFLSSEKTIKDTFDETAIETISFKNETGEDRQIEIYLVNTKSV